MFLCVPIGQAQTKRPVSAAVKKTCAPGVILKLSSASTTQGSLLLAEISGAKPSQEFSAEWAGRPIPVWRETPASPTLQGLLGWDLENLAGQYEWKFPGTSAVGKPFACSLLVTVPTGNFPTHRRHAETKSVS